jgi:Predicted signal-transduction protein containing cAMP-binding and CBS domains
MIIRAIMSTDLVTISSVGNLQEAVTKMLDEDVGCVVVKESDDPVTVEPETSPEEAVETMKKYGIKKLPVLEGGSVVGIVTLTDLVYHHHDLIGEVKDIERLRPEVEITPK